MAEGIRIGGGGGGVMKNGMVVKLPAYSDDIKPNTFVSLKEAQSKAEELVINDRVTIQKILFGRVFPIDDTHWIFIYLGYNDGDSSSYTYLYACLITHNIETDQYSATYSENFGKVETTEYQIVRAEGNTFVIHTSGSKVQTYNRKQTTDVITVNDNYAISRVGSRNTTNEYRIGGSITTQTGTSNPGIDAISYCGNNLFLVYGGIASGARVYPATSIFQLSSAGVLSKIKTISSSCGSSSYWYDIGATSGGNRVLVNIGSAAIKIAQVTTDGITDIASTTLLAWESLPTMRRIGENKYAILGHFGASKPYGRLVLATITDTTIEINNTYSFVGINNDMFDNHALWDEQASELYIPCFSLSKISIDVDNMTAGEETVLKSGSDLQLGGCLPKTRVVEAPLYNGSAFYGIARFNIADYQECVVDSLETNAISGVTLSKCTYDKPGKVCVLNVGTAVATTYGISEAVVTNIKGDTIQEVQDELNS